MSFDYVVLPASSVDALPSLPVRMSVAGQTMTFSGTPKEGHILLTANGEAYLNPGFDLVQGSDTGPDKDLVLGGQGAPTLSGQLLVLAPNQRETGPVRRQEVAVRPFSLLLVQAHDGTYDLVGIQSATEGEVSFAYVPGKIAAATGSWTGRVTVAGHTLTFPDTVRAGQVVAEGEGEVSISPGFDFEGGKQVSALHGGVGFQFGTAPSGLPGISGVASLVPVSGRLQDWPVSRWITPRAGDSLLLVDNLGNYVLMHVDAISASQVRFRYQILSAALLPTLPVPPIRLLVGGSPVGFAGPVHEGRILSSVNGEVMENPGFVFALGQEVGGLTSPADVVLTGGPVGGTAYLSGYLAGVTGGSSVLQPSVCDPMKVRLRPFARLLAVDGDGRYVLVGIQSVGDGVATFAYTVQTSGASALLQPPHVPAVAAVRNIPGTLVYAVLTNAAFRFQTVNPAGNGLDENIIRLITVRQVDFAQNYRGNLAGTVYAERPRLSPNGKWLATVVPGRAVVVQNRSGEREALCLRPGIGAAANWSPDSRFLAVSGQVAHAGLIAPSGGLWVADVASKKFRLVVSPFAAHVKVASVHWLPGDRLVFSTQDAFYRVSADWKRIVKLPIDAGARIGNNGQFDVSPNGRFLAWSAPDATGHYQVFVAPVAGGKAVQFTDHPFDSWSPRFSPDGNLILYVGHVSSSLPGGFILGMTLGGRFLGHLQTATKQPVSMVVDLEQWYPGSAGTAWSH